MKNCGVKKTKSKLVGFCAEHEKCVKKTLIGQNPNNLKEQRIK